MKKFILPFIAIFSMVLSSTASQAQDSVKVDPTLKGQYQLMLSKSRTLDGYKLVNPNRLAGFWKSVRDTISTERRELTQSKAKVAQQQETINKLQRQIEGKESALSDSNARLNEISFLGMSFSKSTYNTIVWTLIIVLGLGLIIAIIRSAKLAHEARYRSGLYNEIAAEYQGYKVKANDKEKKLARELQDERNKFEEYRSGRR